MSVDIDITSVSHINMVDNTLINDRVACSLSQNK